MPDGARWHSLAGRRSISRLSAARSGCRWALLNRRSWLALPRRRRRGPHRRNTRSRYRRARRRTGSDRRMAWRRRCRNHRLCRYGRMCRGMRRGADRRRRGTSRSRRYNGAHCGNTRPQWRRSGGRSCHGFLCRRGDSRCRGWRTRGGPRGSRCRRTNRRLRLGRRELRRLGGGFLFRFLAKVLAHQFGVLDVNRAGMRLFLRDADLRQEIDQDFGLDLQFPGQFIDADLIGIAHSPL